MSYTRVLVPLDLGPTAADRVKLAGSFAAQIGASLIGVAARPVVLPSYGHRYDPLLVSAEEERAGADLDEAEALFRRETPAGTEATWRSALAPPLGFVTRQSRAADLVVMSRRGKRDGDPGLLGFAPGDLLMELGRPVLLVPPNLDRVHAERVVVAWKDTREARRAVFDALPLLKRSSEVFVVAVETDPDREGPEDVAQYLVDHGVKASAQIIVPARSSVAEELLAVVAQKEAGVLVTGAYGHNRLREWIFGGVTAELLEGTPVCCLMSH